MSKRRKICDDAYVCPGRDKRSLDTSNSSLTETDRSSSSGGVTSLPENSQSNLIAAVSSDSSLSPRSLFSRLSDETDQVTGNVFSSLPYEVLETIFSYLSIAERLSLYSVLSQLRQQTIEAHTALSSPSLWRQVRLIARRPDHLTTLSAGAGELLLARSVPPQFRDRLLDFFPPMSPANVPKILVVYLLRKHMFELPFDFLLSALITQKRCRGVRSFTFAIEEVWHSSYYPLRRSEAALDRVAQLIEALDDTCKEINLVKWPRLQDDTIIEQTLCRHSYSEMQAHYASTDLSTTDPLLAIQCNTDLIQNLRTLSIFWFDFEDPEFWSIGRSDWCIMSHQWVWSEEEFSSGHTLYTTQANREFHLVDCLTNLMELRLSLSAYTDDRFFLDPHYCSMLGRGTLERVRLILRASWNGWDSFQTSGLPPGAYWQSLADKLPYLRVTLTFVEFFDFTKFSERRVMFHPKVPVDSCQWLPGAVATLYALRCIALAWGQTLTRLDVHCELIDENGRDKMTLLADTVKVIRECRHLTHIVLDSTVSLHFVKIVVRIRKTIWKRLVFFRDKLHKPPKNDALTAFEKGMAALLGRPWRLHTKNDRERGPRFYDG